MTQPEFEAWAEFYRRWPFDDRHRYYRPAALVSSAFGLSLDRSLDWLCPSDGSVDALSSAFGVPVR